MRKSRVRRHRKKKYWSGAMSSGRFPCCRLAIKQSKLEIRSPYSEQHFESQLLGLGLRRTHKETKLTQPRRSSGDEGKAKRLRW